MWYFLTFKYFIICHFNARQNLANEHKLPWKQPLAIIISWKPSSQYRVCFHTLYAYYFLCLRIILCGCWSLHNIFNSWTFSKSTRYLVYVDINRLKWRREKSLWTQCLILIYKMARLNKAQATTYFCFALYLIKLMLLLFVCLFDCFFFNTNWFQSLPEI